MKHTSAKRQEILKNISCIRKINKSHEARNYKHHLPEKHKINIGQEAKNIINISCQKIHETNINYEARQ